MNAIFELKFVKYSGIDNLFQGIKPDFLSVKTDSQTITTSHLSML